jgi:aminomethyltransferase
LRLEAGLCLHGSDIDLETSPIEAALEWAIQKTRRRAGARAGGFPGDELILTQLEQGAPRRRVGLQSTLRPVRAGAPLYADEASIEPIGRVTSGGFGPTVKAPVAMGYIQSSKTSVGTRVYAEVRGERQLMNVVALPFTPHNYHR